MCEKSEFLTVTILSTRTRKMTLTFYILSNRTLTVVCLFFFTFQKSQSTFCVNKYQRIKQQLQGGSPSTFSLRNCSDTAYESHGTYVYHCILDEKDEAREICMPWIWAGPGECPIYRNLQIEKEECLKPECPKTRYESYNVFRYEACLIPNKNNRKQFEIEKPEPLKCNNYDTKFVVFYLTMTIGTPLAVIALTGLFCI